MIRPRRDAVDSPSSHPPLRLKYVEAVLSIGFALAFIAWTRLSAPGPLAPNADPSSSGGPFGLDLLLPAPVA